MREQTEVTPSNQEVPNIPQKSIGDVEAVSWSFQLSFLSMDRLPMAELQLLVPSVDSFTSWDKQ